MPSDPRYDYPIVAASKVIIRNGDKIIFTREPLDNAWMPGRLGLPGGKYFLNEGIIDGTKRKIENEAGVNCNLLGLFKIVQILMPDKTVYHYVFVADYISGEADTSKVWSDELKWLTRSEVEALNIEEVTEYYYPEVLKEYFTNPDKIVPLDIIREQPTYKDPLIQEWVKKGSQPITK